MQRREQIGWIVCVLALMMQGVQTFAPMPTPIVGERQLDIQIVHEANDDNTQWGKLWSDLRNEKGSFAPYLQQKRHMLDIIDKDAEDETGKKVVNPADLAEKKLPAVLCYDAKSHKLVVGDSISDPSVDAVMNIVRRAGG